MIPDPTMFFEAAREYGRSADNAESKGWNRCGTVDPDYIGTGPARIMFDGETLLSQKAYHFVGAPPLSGKRVVLLPLGPTYVIVGTLNGGA